MTTHVQTLTLSFIFGLVFLGMITDFFCSSVSLSIKQGLYQFSCRVERNDSWKYLGACVLSRVWLFATPWTVAHQAPLSMEFSRQKYWSELPFPTPGDLPDSGIKLASLVSPALPGGLFITEPPWKPMKSYGWQIQVQTLFFWAPKSLQMVIAAMKLKDAYSLEEKLWAT